MNKYFQDPPDEDFDEMADQGNWQTASEPDPAAPQAWTIEPDGAYGWEPEE